MTTERPWHTLYLGDALMAHLSLCEIETAMRAACAATATPGLAVFTRYDQEGSLHCRVTVYFSPASDHIAAQFHAEPCRRPAQAGLALLAGDERSWGLLFADRMAATTSPAHDCPGPHLVRHEAHPIPDGTTIDRPEPDHRRPDR